MHSLEAKIRTTNARDTRAAGLIPAVVYGKDVPSTSISVGVSEFIKLYRVVGQNHIVTLSLDGKKHNVLVHEAQRHPVSGAFLHLDFIVVDMKAEVHVQIPVTLTGTSPAILAGGQLHQSLDVLDVKCLPKDLIDAFELDISTITEIGQTLHVSDIKVDEKKYTVLNQSEEAVATVHAPRKAVEEETPAATEAAAPAAEAPAAE